MKKHLLPLAAAALLLTGCSTSEEPAEPTTSTTSATSSSTTSSSINSSTSAAAPPTTEPALDQEPAAVEQAVQEPPVETAGDYYPGDPRLIPMNTISDTVGSFFAEDATSSSGKYYVFCNGGTLTKSEGAPIESGTCSDLVTYDEVNVLGMEFSDVLMVEVEKAFSDMESDVIPEMEKEGYATPTGPMPWDE